MKGDYATNSRYITHAFAFWKVGRKHFLSSGVKELIQRTVIATRGHVARTSIPCSLSRKLASVLCWKVQGPHKTLQGGVMPCSASLVKGTMGLLHFFTPGKSLIQMWVQSPNRKSQNRVSGASCDEETKPSKRKVTIRILRLPTTKSPMNPHSCSFSLAFPLDSALPSKLLSTELTQFGERKRGSLQYSYQRVAHVLWFFALWYAHCWTRNSASNRLKSEPY